ncbi:amidase family protein [Paenibacillus sp. PK3_47]|uniref:amidase family protein n=1 Tax=Paenibacillus sp. PK3_47 TaxID=2072642 RepID=UPI00201E69D4|nr:amidase family protein [Paenibacillus sp. PK3_47]
MVLNNSFGAFIAPELTVPFCVEGVLSGRSFAVKDVFAVAGHRSSAGNPDWLSSHEPSAEHSAAVHRLLHAGADLRGAAHTDELMYSLGGENYHYGTPVNPRAAGRIPGGSSSGSAVAVASGSVDFALGTDTGGSVRVPSAYCGIYGFRPTHGAVDMSGVIPLALSFDTVGWMADSAELLLRVGEVLLKGAFGRNSVAVPVQPTNLAANYSAVQTSLTGTEKDTSRMISQGEIRQKRAGWGSAQGIAHQNNGMARLFTATDCWTLAGPESAAYLKGGLSRLQAGAERIVETVISAEGLKSWMDAFRELQGAEIWATHGAWIENRQPVFGPDIAARFAWAAGLAGGDHRHAQSLREEVAARLTHLLGEDGCLVIPTVPGPAPLRGGDLKQLELNRSGAMMLSCIAGLAGLPQVTLPVTGPGGLPLGLSVIGGHGQDHRLLSWVSHIWQPASG